MARDWVEETSHRNRDDGSRPAAGDRRRSSSPAWEDVQNRWKFISGSRAFPRLRNPLVPHPHFTDRGTEASKEQGALSPATQQRGRTCPWPVQTRAYVDGPHTLSPPGSCSPGLPGWPCLEEGSPCPVTSLSPPLARGPHSRSSPRHAPHLGRSSATSWHRDR